MLTSSLFKDYFEMVLARQEQGLAKNHTCRQLADNDNINKDKLKVIKHTSMMTIRIIAITTITYTSQSRQRLKTGGLANSRGTNLQSVIPSLDGSKAG